MIAVDDAIDILLLVLTIIAAFSVFMSATVKASRKIGELIESLCIA